MNREEFDQLFNGLTHIGQNADEMWEVVEELQGRNIQSMIEIGVPRGGSMRIWDAAIGTAILLVSTMRIVSVETTWISFGTSIPQAATSIIS
jgi:hypothetical protein